MTFEQNMKISQAKYTGAFDLCSCRLGKGWGTPLFYEARVVPRHLVRWWERAAERGGGGPGPHRKTPPQRFARG